jgi:hypothetical protein
MANLYADAIFAENPTALWALDDNLAVASLSALPSNIALSGYGTPALAYGSERNQGYYIGTSSTTSTLKARASGVPMVYGATNITSLDANSTNPSLIIPGLGFLNEDGKNKNLTLEVWLRAYPTAHIPRRIIGPITGDNGLYINGQFLTLKIGDNIGSHYVGEWARPMLIHIYYTGSSAGVLLNGESVISINYDYLDIEFPTKLNDSSDDQDWIGFYGYSDVSLLQLDCISLYAYQVSVDKAKLHFVKGQSVESPEIKNTSYFDVPMIIDYQMSKYANNYIYPGNGRWKNGIVNNLSTDNNVLSAPDYQLPQLVLEDGYQTLRAWNSLQRELTGQSDTTTLSDGEVMDNDVFFRIVPDNVENPSTAYNYAGYLYFDKLNVLQDPTKAIYGVFSVSSLPTSDELLFRISNSSNEYFEAVVNDNDVIYRFVSPAGNVTISTANTNVAVSTNTKFVAGINIDALVAQQNNQQISKFFNDSANLKVFLGGPPSFNGGTTIDLDVPKLFGGNIYKFGFMNENNLSKISAQFSEGLASNTNVLTTFNTHFASYTLIGVNTLNSFSLDIAVNGTWKDYISLSQLDRQTVRDAGGNVASSLDFIQFNIDVPELANVTNSSIRTYVEFSEIATSVVSSNQITKTNEALSSNYTITPTDEVTPTDNWVNKKYELVNNTIIYLPTVGFNSYSDLGLVTHLEFFVPGIMRNPTKIKMLHIASQALNYSGMKTPIGTRYGKDIYSFGADRSYSAKNPYTIYKNTTPYLYLTNYSGIKLVGTTFDGTRGIEIPINPSAKPYYTVSVLEASILYEKPFTADVELFRIKHNSDTLVIYADYTSPTSTSAVLKAKKTNGDDMTSTVQFFVNGVEDQATIRSGEWNMVGILFKNLLRFGERSDNRIDITGPFVVNNVSDYQIDQAAEDNNYTFYLWSQTLGAAPERTWTQVAADSATWNNTLISETAGVAIKLDAAAIYSSYFGNSRISGTDDNYKVSISQNDYSSYVGIRSSLISVSPL